MTSEFIEGGLEMYRHALTQATDEELREMVLEHLHIPDEVESVQKPERREYLERMIEHILSLPRDALIDLLVPTEALY